MLYRRKLNINLMMGQRLMVLMISRFKIIFMILRVHHLGLLKISLGIMGVLMLYRKRIALGMYLKVICTLVQTIQILQGGLLLTSLQESGQ